MKVLFVCRANVVRSQMAAAFYNQLSGTDNADSAGIMVDEPGQTLQQRAQNRPAARFVIEVMAQKGIPVAHSHRTLLTKEMCGNYDLIINMAADRYVPKWLSGLPRYRYWAVADPMGRGFRATAKARDIIEQKIKTLFRPT